MFSSSSKGLVISPLPTVVALHSPWLVSVMQIGEEIRTIGSQLRVMCSCSIMVLSLGHRINNLLLLSQHRTQSTCLFLMPPAKQSHDLNFYVNCNSNTRLHSSLTIKARFKSLRTLPIINEPNTLISVIISFAMLFMPTRSQLIMSLAAKIHQKSSSLQAALLPPTLASLLITRWFLASLLRCLVSPCHSLMSYALTSATIKSSLPFHLLTLFLVNMHSPLLTPTAPSTVHSLGPRTPSLRVTIISNFYRKSNSPLRKRIVESCTKIGHVLYELPAALKTQIILPKVKKTKKRIPGMLD